MTTGSLARESERLKLAYTWMAGTKSGSCPDIETLLLTALRMGREGHRFTALDSHGDIVIAIDLDPRSRNRAPGQHEVAFVPIKIHREVERPRR